MKFTLLFLLFSITQISFAQVFLERPQTPPIDSVSFGAIAFADVDGDSDQDLLITGQNAPGLLIAKLYLNDGGGNFSEKTGTPFKAVSASAIAFADVDGDSDQDLFITGQGRFDSLFSILYLNDGVGNFTEVADPPFDSVDAGSVAFADVDGDADKDLLITGRSISGVRIAKLYANDGGGGFSEVMGTPFEGVFENSIAFADVDGDTDQDVLITGGRDDGVRISKLYTNDGAGNFTEMLGTPFEGVTSSSVAIADVDGDLDQDILITGLTNNGDRIANLYINNGVGSFTEMTPSPFGGIERSSIAFADVDGDSDQDVLFTGIDSVATTITKLYLNDGSGDFTEVMNNPFEECEFGSIAFADVDGDSDQDVLITGRNASLVRLAKLYLNNSVISAAEDSGPDVRLNLVLYPIPSKPSTLFIDYNAAETGEVTMQVYNLHGALLHQQKVFAVGGPQTFSVDIRSFAKGHYVLKLFHGTRLGVAKFMVQ